MANFVGVLLLMSWVVACLVGFAVLAVCLHRGHGSPRTPVGGTTTPRTVPPTGPKQPDAAPSPPTRGSVRCRRPVPPGDPNLGDTVAPGWRMR